MKVSANQASFLRQSVRLWRESGHLDEDIASRLEQSIEVDPFEWKKLAKYAFWAAIASVIIAATSILADRALIAFVRAIFGAPDAVLCVALAVLAAALYGAGWRQRFRLSIRGYGNEAIHFLGVLSTAGAIYYLGKTLDTGSGHFSVLLLLSCLIYGGLGYALKSNLIWVFSLLSLGGWMGAETGYAAGWGSYYLGMNYPLRFVLFGGCLTAVALSLEKRRWFETLAGATLSTGLLYLFVALWILSIFGNYGDLTSWNQAKLFELFHWSVLFAVVAGAAIYHGLRFDNGTTRGFGITFLFINFYTRFFEYFWDTTHKAVFFVLLGASFWFLGSRAEKIWRMGRPARAPVAGA